MRSLGAPSSLPSAMPLRSPQLSITGLFDRRRIVGYCAVLLAIEVALFAFLVAGTHGWITPLDKPTTTDFASFYAAGALANAGTPQLAYDHAAHLTAEEAVAAPGIEYQYFNYPPVFLILCAGLAHLPYLPAFVLFEAATLLLYLWIGCRVIDDRGIGALVVLLAFPMVFWNFGLGQNGFLTAALFGAATLALERRPVLAGILFGALCYKPHFGLLVPVALAAGGYWRAFTAAAISTALFVLVSLALFGADTWRDFLSVATASREMYASGRIRFGGFVSPFGAVRLLGGPIDAAYAVQAVAGLVAAAVVFLAWRRRGLPLATRSATLIAATLVAAPVSLLYDLLSGAMAAAWLVRDDGNGGATPSEKTVLAFLFISLLAGLNIAEATQIPVFPLTAMAFFVLVLRRAWREMAPPSKSALKKKGAVPVNANPSR